MLLSTPSMTPLTMMAVMMVAVSASIGVTWRPPRPQSAECLLDDSSCWKDYLQNDVIGRFRQGFPEYGVASMDPLNYNDISFTFKAGTVMDITLTHMNPLLYGLAKSKVLDVSTQLTDSTYIIEAKLSIPKMLYEGSYKTSGVWLLMPMEWNGQFNTSLGDVIDTWKISADIVEKDGKRYLDLNDVSFSPEVKNFKTYASGLFWGNEDMGRLALQITNQNWTRFFKTMWKFAEPEILKSAANGIRSIFKNTPITGLLPTGPESSPDLH